MLNNILFFCYGDQGNWRKTYSQLWQKINSGEVLENSFVLFKHEGWNDFGFFSNFQMYFYRSRENITDLGVIKIIQKDNYDTKLPKKFYSLENDKFYSRIKYEHKKKIRELGCVNIFHILNEVEENCITPSILRDVDDSGSLESGFISSLYRDDEPSNISTDFGSITRDFIEELRLMLNSEELFKDQLQKDIYLKMLFGNSITILETYLYDVVKFNIINYEVYFKNFLKFDNFGKEKVELQKIGSSSKPFEDYLKSLVGDKISNITFHNVNYVQKIFKEVLNCEVNLAKFSSDIIKRNDIFHRNGKDKKGNEISIQKEDIFFLLKQIEKTINLIEKNFKLE